MKELTATQGNGPLQGRLIRSTARMGPSRRMDCSGRDEDQVRCAARRAHRRGWRVSRTLEADAVTGSRCARATNHS